MIRGLSLVLGLTALAALARGAEGPAEPTLFVGDAAPPLAMGKWLRGEPVRAIEPGKVYVVEFWATWCGPCVAAIPHVSKLQERYKDQGVIFIGQNVSEEDAATKVPPFLARMGSRMNYRVALDDVSKNPDGAMYTAWQRAADAEGLPCSFVVGRDGKLAWIGHPMGMDEPLKGIVEGTYDPIREAGNREAQVMRHKVVEVMDKDPGQALKILDEVERLPNPPRWVNRRRMIVLSGKKDDAGAHGVMERAAAAPGAKAADVMDLVEEILPGWMIKPDAGRLLTLVDRAAGLPGGDAPDLRARLAAARFKLLILKKDYPAANRAAAALAESPGDDPQRLTQIAWMIATEKGMEPRDLGVAAKLVDRAAAMARTPEDAFEVQRARLGVELRNANEAGVADALAKLIASPETTLDELQAVAESVANEVGEGRAASAAATQLLDRAAALAASPADQEAVRMARFRAGFRQKDYPAAYAAARDLADAPETTANALNTVAWHIATDEGLAQRDLDVAERLSARAVELTGGANANLLDTYARVMFEKGQVARAVVLQSQAVQKSAERMRPELQATLDRYKATLK